MAYLLVEIKGPFDSKKLWGLISRYGVNLTDIGDIVLVHGEVDFKDHVDILAFCALFGEFAYTYGGEYHGKEEETEDPEDE